MNLWMVASYCVVAFALGFRCWDIRDRITVPMEPEIAEYVIPIVIIVVALAWPITLPIGLYYRIRRGKWVEGE